MAVAIAPPVTVGPGVCSGKPVLRGTRVPVALVIGKLAGGMSNDELMSEYDLEMADVRAALAYWPGTTASED